MLTCTQLNTNSGRNKFDSLIDMVNNKTDILMILETKLYYSFPTGQFYIRGLSESYRLDRKSKGGGLLLYVRDDILSKLILGKKTIEGFFVEIGLRKKNTYLLLIFRAISRDFSGTPHFEMVIFPYQHHCSLEMRKLWVFNTSDLLKTYSVESNRYHYYHVKHSKGTWIIYKKNILYASKQEGTIGNLLLTSIISTYQHHS